MRDQQQPCKQAHSAAEWPLGSVWPACPRRRFLAGLAKTCLGVHTLPRVFRPQATSAAAPARLPASGGRAKRVIYLYMDGGMSHLDTFDTKPGAETQGPVESIPTTATGLHVSEYFPGLAKEMKHVAVINSLTSTQGAHAPGRYFMHTSYFLRGTIQHPDLGAYSAKLLRASNLLPPNIKIDSGSAGLGGGFLESEYAALPIGNPMAGLQHSELPKSIDEDRFQRRLRRVEQMNAKFAQGYSGKSVRAHTSLYESAVKLMKSKDLPAFDISQEPQAVREAYGDDRFGQGVLLARRLIEHDVRFVEVTLSGWDTHVDNFDRVEEKSGVLDQALSQLLKELSERGLLDDTLVVVATEFGRTPEIVADRNNGRNHYPKAFSCLLAGAGIQGGHAYGKTDKEGREIVESEVSVPDFNATIAYAIGLPWQSEIISPSRRPFKIAAEGRPITSIFS